MILAETGKPPEFHAPEEYCYNGKASPRMNPDGIAGGQPVWQSRYRLFRNCVPETDPGPLSGAASRKPAQQVLIRLLRVITDRFG